jgi:hypothetical protein
MTTLTCPKCRQGMPDEALDVGQCPACGFPLDGPVVLAAPGARSEPRWGLIATVVLLIGAGAGFSYAYFSTSEADANRPPEEVAAGPAVEAPIVPARHIAPFPHEPKRADSGPNNPTGPPTDPPGMGDKGQPPVPPVPGPGEVEPPKLPVPVPPVVEPPKKVGPRPIGVVMRVDPKVAAARHFDHPDDTAAVPDLNTGHRVVLTGKVRVLRLGSVLGKGVLDASGLVAEEVVITGDLNNEAQVLVNAPQGKVTVGGYVAGAAKLTVLAPGGELVIAPSGRVAGGATVTATTKRLNVMCPLSGAAKVNVTLTAAGFLKWKLAEEGATITYKQAAANDPPPTIERGELRGGAKVIPGK